MGFYSAYPGVGATTRCASGGVPRVHLHTLNARMACLQDRKKTSGSPAWVQTYTPVTDARFSSRVTPPRAPSAIYTRLERRAPNFPVGQLISPYNTRRANLIWCNVLEARACLNRPFVLRNYISRRCDQAGCTLKMWKSRFVASCIFQKPRLSDARCTGCSDIWLGTGKLDKR